MSRLAAGRGWALLLAAALAVTALAAWRATGLRVTTRLEELLPEGSPAADDYRRFLTTFGGFEKVYVLVRWHGDDPDAALLAEAADRVASSLAAVPEVARVRSGLQAADEDFLRRWVLPRAPLFLGGDSAAVSADELRARFEPAAVRRRASEIRRAVASPGGAVEGPWLAADPLGFSGGLAALAAGGGSAARVDPFTGAFLSPAGNVALVVATPAAGELDAAAGHALLAALEAARRQLGEDFPRAPLDVLAVGGPLYAAQDETVVRADLIRTLSGSALAVALLLVLYFGGVAAPLALAMAVLSGVAWTAGLTAVLHGEVSVLGLSFAALLLGLGVDYGIHLASRFRAARLGGARPGAAAFTAVREVGPPILASALTTGAAFLVLSAAHFRPVREMGLVMTGGIVAILLATAAVGLPVLVLAARWTAPPGGGSRTSWRTLGWRGLGRATHAAVRLGAGRPRTVAAVAAVLTLLSLWGLRHLDVSLDLRALRPADHPAFAAEELLVQSFAVGLDASTVVVEGADLEQALDKARRVEKVLAARLPQAAEVASPARWLPTAGEVARRLAVIGGEPAAAAAAALRQGLVEEGLNPRPFAAALAVLDAAARGEAPPPIPESAWPDWVGELVRRLPDGGYAAAVRVSTPLGTWPEGPSPELLAALRQTVGDDVAVASVPRLGAELRGTVLDDFRSLGGWALLAVAAVVLISFRGRPRPSLLALLPVALGGLWTLGLAAAAGVALDPFTVVVAPLLLGIGIDDGLHALQGARLHGGVVASLRENGRAMALTTLTTCAGFGSLVASRVPSLRGGGALVAAGTALCLVATLVVLPAVDALSGGRDGGER